MSEPASTASARGTSETQNREWFPLLGAVVSTVWELFLGSSAAAPVLDMNPASARCWLVVGLGNHGMAGTRHSVGMEAVTHIAAELGLRWSPDRDCKGTVAMGQTDAGTDVVLLRPKLLMNVNGRSVAAAARKFDVQPSHVVLLHDDLDKAFGKISLKHGGSARGHNGVRSSIECLKSDEMLRMRIGIGRPADRSDVTRFVLGAFTDDENLELRRKVFPDIYALFQKLVNMPAVGN